MFELDSRDVREYLGLVVLRVAETVRMENAWIYDIAEQLEYINRISADVHHNLTQFIDVYNQWASLTMNPNSKKEEVVNLRKERDKLREQLVRTLRDGAF
jgi:hypothetical protein